jgi:hypothetical protein
MSRRSIVAVLLVLFLAPAAYAALTQVGPVTPDRQYLGNVNSGFPLYYMDGNGVALDLPRPPIGDGLNAPTMIYFAPNPANAYSSFLGFDAEAFYYYARSVFNTKYGKATALFGLEGSFLNGVAQVGQEMVFARIRLKAPVRDAGTYTFYHPWGVETIVVTAADVAAGKAISYTRDVGLVPRDFAGALAGPIGPFLTATNMVGNAVWVGDGATVTTVTGTPATVDARGFNQVTLEGPPGIDLDGRKNNFVTANQWTIAGHKAGQTPASLHVDRATCYTDPAGREWVDVFATANPTATVTVSGPSIVDPTRTFLQTWTLIPDLAGKFYIHAPSNEALHEIPGTPGAPFPITVAANVPGFTTTTLTASVLDQVNVAKAEYSESAFSLTINATSTDGAPGDTAPPALTGLGLKALTGTLADPILTFNPVTALYTLTIGGPTARVLVPPPTVTVTSTMGGSDTTPVVIVP